MASGSDRKYWYKISVEALRLWTTLSVLAVLGVVGFFGYGFLQRHLQRRQIEATMLESQQLLERLRTEEGLANFRREYRTAQTSLEEAAEHIVAGRIEEALKSSERGRTLLHSILDALQLRSPAGEAQFIAIQGGVEFRRGERGEWREARSRVVLYSGDYIKTGRGGSAEVMTVDGTLFTVRPDTVLLVGSSRSLSGGLREQTFALESGWVNLSTSQNTGRITTPAAEARVEQRTQALVTYDKDTDSGRFAAYRGALEVVSRAGEKRRVGELEQVVQNAEVLSASRSLPSAPMLLDPRDNLEVFLDAASELVLSWEPVQGASHYALQVSRDRLFVDNVIDVERRVKTRATLGLRGEGSFVWRVAAFDGKGAQGPWSLPKKFRVTARRRSVEREPAEIADPAGA